MLSEAHLTVEKLVRVRVMNIKGDKLKPGQVWILGGRELENFLKNINLPVD
jgi:16S rRNA U516 pseudouridylate synthase RsuA-like enzyme